MPSHKKQVTYSSRPNHAARMAHAKGERQFKTYDTSLIRPKRSKVPLVIAVVLALAVIAGLVWGMLTLFNGCSDSQANLLAEGEQATIVVSEGDGAQSIASNLQRAGLVATAAEFSRRVTELGAESSLKPGTYKFYGGTSTDDIIDQLRAGPEAGGVTLTIPEGFTIRAIAERVAEVTDGRISATDFTEAASDASVYVSAFPFLSEAGTNSLEGFLFPKTYTLANGVTADSLIRAMLSQYQKEMAILDYDYPESLGLSAYETLILASIVEKESPADVEIRAKVAAVFYNRLTSEGEPAYGFLGSDATTAYEIGGDPTDYDWTTNSPYNTRVTTGLPPTPICSPGIESLQAVCSPAADFGDYFFFSFWKNDQGDTDYFFDRTYEEHQATVAAHS